MIEVNLKLISTSKKLIFLQSEDLEDIYSSIYHYCKWTNDSYYLRCNGQEVLSLDDVSGSIQVIPRLRGGKGGFGSMLRAIGAQIEKTTNREACRDLSGRRLRDINEEQRLKKWISQQTEREKEIEERRRKKLEKLSSEPKHEFQDETYFTERSEMSDKLNNAFEQGIQASTSNIKRKVHDEDAPVKKKKKKLLLDFDEFSSSDDAEDKSDGENIAVLELKNEDISVEDAHTNIVENNDKDCAYIDEGTNISNMDKEQDNGNSFPSGENSVKPKSENQSVKDSIERIKMPSNTSWTI